MQLSRTPVGPDDDPVARLRPGCWLVDAGARPPPEHRPEPLLAGFFGGEVGAPAAMAMTLCTARLLRTDFGAALVARLADQGCLLDDLAILALHEIVLNAAIHGNLEVASGRAIAWHDLAAREAALAGALADRRRVDRLVTVALGWNATHLAAFVADEGGGYHPTGSAQDGADGRRGAGRGLTIARAAAEVEILDGGRCTRLLFRRRGAPGPG